MRKRRPKNRPTVHERDLPTVLELAPKDLRVLLAAVEPALTRGRDRWYRWRDLATVLEADDIRLARIRARKLRRQTATSKYWVAGYPELLAQWHERNDALPDEISHGSHRNVWWRCPAGPDHEWKAKVANRVRGAGCPFCAHKRASVTNSLASCHPHVAAEWHPTKNGAITPADVLRSSSRRYWWKCAAGREHVWFGSVNARTARQVERGCPFCSGMRVSRTNSLAARAPDVARTWHRTKNGALTPNDVTSGSPALAWWQCPTARKHVWQAAIVNRTAQGSGCPFCTGRRASTTNSLARLAPAAAALWHPTKNKALTPNDVTAGSHRVVWFECPRGHAWRRVVQLQGRVKGCPECLRLARLGAHGDP